LQEVPAFNHVPVLTHDIIPLGNAPYALPGSNRLGENISQAFLNDEVAAFMENHGIITTGNNLLASFHKLERLELMARIYIQAVHLGNLLASPDNFRHFLDLKMNTEIHFAAKAERDAIDNKKRNELLSIIKRSYERKLITSTTACFSLRLSADLFIITPANFDIMYLEADDFIEIRNAKVENDRLPSHYWQSHQEIYKKHQHIESICCAQPSAIMAFAVTDARFETHTIPEAFLLLNEIPKLGFGDFYTNPAVVADCLSKKILNVIIENDCIFVAGKNAFEVFDRLEVAEFSASSLISAIGCGKIRFIDKEHIEELKRNFSI
jgi:L-fuculose-phosphate aldolase